MNSKIRASFSVGLISSISYVTYDINNKIWSDGHTCFTATYQYFLHLFMGSVGKYSRNKFDNDSMQFNSIQNQTLLYLLDKHKDTVLGQFLKYKDIKNIDEFRDKVPLTDYNFYKMKYIPRIKNGEENIMTKDKVDLLGATSGTSGYKSLIPHTPVISKIFFLHGITIVFDGLFSKAFPQANQLQKTCKLTFQPRWTYTDYNVKIGPASSSPDDKGFSRLLPLYSSPIEAFKIKNEKAAFYCHILFALNDRNLGIIEANFASIVLQFFNMINENFSHLVNDIENGTINGAKNFGLDENELLTLQKYLKPNKKRAAELKQILNIISGKDDNNDGNSSILSLARSIWPNLHLILTVTTGAFTPYAETLNNKYINDTVPFFSPLYAATEGLIAVNIRPEDDRNAKYALLPKALFYEFLEVQESDTIRKNSNEELSKRTLLAHQLQVGSKYELIITNQAGLVRYRIGDVIKVEGFENETPIISFQYRKGQVLNVRGEKINECILAKAIKDANNSLGVSISDFCAAEDLMLVNGKELNKPRYHIFIEVDANDGDNDNNVIKEGDKVNRIYDSFLQKYSEVYESYRRKDAIELPVVHVVKKGAFEKLRLFALNENTTGSITQFKIPRVLKVKKFVQFLLKEK